MKKLLLAASVGCLLSSVAHADAIANHQDIENDINEMMMSELGDIIDVLTSGGPIIDCGCPHLCAMLGLAARGVVAPEDVPGVLISAMVQDRANALKMAASADGKFDPAWMGTVQVKLEFRNENGRERLAEIAKKVGQVVLQ